VTSIDVVQVSQAVVPNSITNDILIDFTGNLRGQQLVLELTQGSVYQQQVFGTNTAPGSALFAGFPETQYDTFITIGGMTSSTSQPVLVIGGAVDLQPGSAFKFDTQGLNVAWAPGTGIDVPSGTDYPTARITLSNDAQGVLHYFGSTGAGTGDPLTKTMSVCGGMISLHCGGGDPPVVNDFFAVRNYFGEVITATIGATDADSWSELLDFTYVPGFGAPPTAPGLSHAPQWNPDTQEFVWDTTNSSRGTYTWAVEASNSFGTDRGLITVQLFVPEPASGLLLALSLAAFSGRVDRPRGTGPQ
jgi:hypothetical protein